MALDLAPLSVLVVEGEESRRRELRDALAEFRVCLAVDLAAARRTECAGLAAIVVDAALLDAGDLIALAVVAPVVVVADNPSIRDAVECTRRGAADYVPRPFTAAALSAAVRRAAGETPAAGRNNFASMIGDCRPMRDLFRRLRAVAATDATVLIQGESGTGKELVARALHAASSRHRARMIAVNCAAIPEALIEAELFGDERAGAGGQSGAASAGRQGLADAANGGTLFLNEIGDLSAPAQERLLHFLKDGEVELPGRAGKRRLDLRVIAATHQDLRQLVANGCFHEELYCRVSAVSLAVPPLRDRSEDVVAIAVAVLKDESAKLNKRDLAFSADALAAMRRYAWPGNVRELANAVERAVILCRSRTIDADLLAIDAGRGAKPLVEVKSEASGSLKSYFVRFVLDNQDRLTETELASELGISRKSLWERRQRLDIPRRGTRKRGPRRA